MPTCINKLPLYLNTNKKWTYAVYNCVCSHKFIYLINYVRNSRLSYWDKVMVVDSLVDDIVSLHPNNNIICHAPNVKGMQQQPHAHFGVAPTTIHTSTN